MGRREQGKGVLFEDQKRGKARKRLKSSKALRLKSSRIKRSVSLERARVEDLSREEKKKKKSSEEREAQGIGCCGPDTVVCSTRSVSANNPHLGNLLYSKKLFAG